MKFLLALNIIFLVGCSTTGSYIPVNDYRAKSQSCSLKVLMPGQEFKKDSVLIGTFSVQESGLSVNCGWEQTLEKNRNKGCEAGADVIQFLEVNTPSISSTCYTTKANFLKIDK